MQTHAELLKAAFERYDHYMAFTHKALFRFTHKELLEHYEIKTSKKGEPIKSVINVWTEDLGICEEVEVTGGFRGTMIDNITHGICQSLESGSCFYDKYEYEAGCIHLMKSTKIDVVRADQIPPFPSTMTDAELLATWLNPEWNPNG